MNKIVLVTGASKGLGEKIAKEFLNDNDIVYVNYNTTSLEEVKKKYSLFNNAKFIKCDVSSEEEVKKMLSIINEEQGHLDVLVNNAAITLDNDYFDKNKDEFNKVLETNLIGPFLTSKYASNIMLESKKGTIINISSTNAIDTNEIYSMDYDASKAGVNSLTHNFAVLLAPYVNVNAIAAGWIHTDMNQNLDEEFILDENKKILLGRFAEVDEIANVVKFLASDEASYVNNSIIRVDGGSYHG